MGILIDLKEKRITNLSPLPPAQNPSVSVKIPNVHLYLLQVMFHPQLVYFLTVHDHFPIKLVLSLSLQVLFIK